MGAVFARSVLVNEPDDSVAALYVIPIALLALTWGLRMGIAAAVVALALVAAWDVTEAFPAEVADYLTWGAVFFCVAAVVGVGAGELRSARAQERRTRDRNRAIIDAANEAFIATDPHGVIQEWNRAAERTYGWSAEDAVGRSLLETVVPPALRGDFARGMRRYLETGRRRLLGKRLETLALRRDGEEFPIELSSAATGSGSDLVFYSFAHDISKRKETERRLKRAARHFELSHDLVATLAADGTFEQLNERWQTALGWAPDQLRSGTPADFAHPDELETISKEIARIAAGGEAREFVSRFRARDGSWHWLEWAGSMDADEGRIYASARDVTDRIEAELAYGRLGAIVESSGDAIYGQSLDGAITSWNEAAERLYGYTPEEATRMSTEALMPPDLPDDNQAIIERVSSDEVVRDKEAVRMSKGGEHLDVSLTVSPLRDAAGKIVGVSTIARDIGTRKRTQRYLHAQHQATRVLAAGPSVLGLGPRLLLLLAGCADWTCAMYWRALDDGADLQCEATWTAPERRATSLPAREGAIAKPSDDVDGGWPLEPVWHESLEPGSRIPAADPARLAGARAAAWAPVAIDGRVVGGFEFFANESRPCDPHLLNILGSVVAQIGHYIERRRAEQEADRVKHEFFGLISHELRTPLTSIIGYTELLNDFEADLSDQGRKALEVVTRNAQRELRLVSDLLTLVHIDAGRFNIKPEPTDLRELAEGAVAAARPTAARQGVRLCLDAEPLPDLDADPQRMGQVLDNLVTNAIKFSPDGGEVTVRLGASNGHASIEVQDTGMGISPEDRERLFERMFRTQEATDLAIPGTGLGLTIVKAIVDAHGGRIHVESDEGAGTTFRVELPTV